MCLQSGHLEESVSHMLDHFDSHQHEDSEQANSSTTAPSQFAQGKKESDKVNKFAKKT